MKKLNARLRALRTRRDDGASAVEYGLLVALIAVVIAGGVLALGNALETNFGEAEDCIAAPAAGTCP